MAVVLPELLLSDVGAWRAWLAEHQDDPAGVRLVLAKKGKPAPTTLSYDLALPEALCYGWIDGQTGRRDDSTYLVRFTPRRTRSLWSRRNVDIVGRLTEQGRMQPRGLAEVSRAQADGRWQAAYAGAATIEVPDELSTALAGSPEAQAVWEGLDRQNRYACLHRVQTALTAETKVRRAERLVAMLARGETPHPRPGAGWQTDPEDPPAAGPGASG